MMKMSKPHHKLPRSSRGSPGRKDHMIKKTVHPNASMRGSTSSRPMMKRVSPGMKRGPPPPPSKSVHPSRVRSIASPHRSVTRHSMQGPPPTIDRVHGLKRLKYEKRKVSPSPVRHPMPSSSFSAREPSPYQEDHFLNIKPEPHFTPAPMKKKPRREIEHGGSGMAMMHRSEVRQPQGRMIHRSEMPSSRSALGPPVSHRDSMGPPVHGRNERFDPRGRGRGRPSIQPSKRPPPPTKPPYSPPTDHYPSTSRYTPEKHYTPTLHERFSTVVTEPRIKYSREDLEKITIDIHRNLKAESPTVRRIVNPDDVKLVRRANEGHRPMFDRDEIKHPARDMRDEAHYEKKEVYGVASHTREENYEITRHRFDSHRFHSTGGKSLSDRWQGADGKEGAPLDRDHRNSSYDRPPMKRSFPDGRTSKGGDQDFRSERYSAPSTSQSRSEYPPSQHRMISPPSESRNSSINRKPAAPIDVRRKLNIVRRGSDRRPAPSMHDSKSRYPNVEKRYPEGMSSRNERPIDRRSPGMDQPAWKVKVRSESREKSSSFSRRPDKYSYKSYPEKSPSRNPNYYEDNREGSDSYRGRGGSRPFRSRGGRSRGIRGSPRGSFPTRTFRGGYRGRGAPRRGRISPGIWEHDMYLRGSDDHKNFP